MSGRLVLILTYHSISPGPPPLCVSADRFARHLDLLAAAGFTTLPLPRLVEALAEHRPLPHPCCALTFDDGYRDFATAALPALEARGMATTLFVTAARDRSGLPGGAGGPLLAHEELCELAGRGVEIGAHTVDHVDLTGLDDAALDDQLRRGRALLEEHAGRPVEHLAYPFGHADARVHTAATRYFRSACTTRLAAVDPTAADLWALPRLDAYYLASPLLRTLLAHRRPQPYLHLRRWLRRMRGTERSGTAGARPYNEPEPR